MFLQPCPATAGGRKSVRAWQCVALNTNGRATIHGFALGGCHRRARTPSLMLRPNGLAPARHLRFAKVPPGVPFASPARESRRALLDCHRANPPGHDIQRLRRAGDGGENSPLRGSAGEIGLRGSRGNLASGQLSPRCRAAGLPRCETVRTRGGNLHGCSTPCRQAPRATLCRHGVQTSGFALARLCRGNCAA